MLYPAVDFVNRFRTSLRSHHRPIDLFDGPLPRFEPGSEPFGLGAKSGPAACGPPRVTATTPSFWPSCSASRSRDSQLLTCPTPEPCACRSYSGYENGSFDHRRRVSRGCKARQAVREDAQPDLQRRPRDYIANHSPEEVTESMNRTLSAAGEERYGPISDVPMPISMTSSTRSLPWPGHSDCQPGLELFRGALKRSGMGFRIAAMKATYAHLRHHLSREESIFECRLACIASQA